jgi:hypothetical protein
MDIIFKSNNDGTTFFSIKDQSLAREQEKQLIKTAKRSKSTFSPVVR